jgi:hypothetical protein
MDEVVPLTSYGHVHHTQSYCFGLTKILANTFKKKAPTWVLVSYKFYGINARLARSFCFESQVNRFFTCRLL